MPPAHPPPQGRAGKCLTKAGAAGAVGGLPKQPGTWVPTHGVLWPRDHRQEGCHGKGRVFREAGHALSFPNRPPGSCWVGQLVWAQAGCPPAGGRARAGPWPACLTTPGVIHLDPHALGWHGDCFSVSALPPTMPSALPLTQAQRQVAHGSVAGWRQDGHALAAHDGQVTLVRGRALETGTWMQLHDPMTLLSLSLHLHEHTVILLLLGQAWGGTT